MVEKQKVWRKVHGFYESTLEGNLDDVISNLQKYREQYKDKNVRLSSVPNKYEEGYHLEMHIEDEETDAEFAARISREDADRIRTEKWEREQLEKLMAKYPQSKESVLFG